METFKSFLGWSGGFVVLCAVGSAVPALAQDYQNPYPPQHYNYAPGLDAPGLTNIPGVRDEPPSYGSRPSPYVPYSTATPTYPSSPHLSPYPSSSPYGSEQNGSNPYSTSGDDDK
jgi:hypothetical protein